jgi:hypothetical protein
MTASAAASVAAAWQALACTILDGGTCDGLPSVSGRTFVDADIDLLGPAPYLPTCFDHSDIVPSQLTHLRDSQFLVEMCNLLHARLRDAVQLRGPMGVVGFLYDHYDAPAARTPPACASSSSPPQFSSPTASPPSLQEQRREASSDIIAMAWTAVRTFSSTTNVRSAVSDPARQAVKYLLDFVYSEHLRNCYCKHGVSVLIRYLRDSYERLMQHGHIKAPSEPSSWLPKMISWARKHRGASRTLGTVAILIEHCQLLKRPKQDGK